MKRVLLALAATGCVPYIETTHVTLHHSAPVAVEVETPAGPMTVMAQDAIRGEIPESVPPYIGTAEQGSWVERNGVAIDAWCPQCATYRKRTLFDRQILELAGNAYELLHFGRDELRIRSDFPREYRCGSKHPHMCTTPKLRLALVTPLANVESIRFDRVVPHDGDTTIVGVGVAVVAVGAALGGLGLADHDRAELAVGGGWMVLGATIVVVMVANLLATDQHIAIFPRQSASTAVAP